MSMMLMRAVLDFIFLCTHDYYVSVEYDRDERDDTTHNRILIGQVHHAPVDEDKTITEQRF